MRKIQKTYMLEPAGSHGVWGLDDFQHLPYYFGASQLIGNNLNILPKSIHDRSVVTNNTDNYLYLSSINFILEVTFKLSPCYL